MININIKIKIKKTDNLARKNVLISRKKMPRKIVLISRKNNINFATKKSAIKK